MPKGEFKSITVREEFYDKLEDVYEILKKENKLPNGIHSFSGYVDYKLSQHLYEKQSLQKFAQKINCNKIPIKFLQCNTVIKSIISTPHTN